MGPEAAPAGAEGGEPIPRALGSIVTATGADDRFSLHLPIFDYYDHWSERDARLAQFQEALSVAAEALAHDLVAMGAYAQQMLFWVKPENIRASLSVVSVGAMAEAYIASLRCAADAVAMALGLTVNPNLGQVPSESLADLLKWAAKNPRRVSPAAQPVLAANLEWFWRLRSIRDHIVHSGAHPNIHCDGRQFNLGVYSPRTGWVTRESLFPMLAGATTQLLALAERVGVALHLAIPLPPDRLRSRTLCGVSLPYLKTLISDAPRYAAPSP